MAVVGSLNVDRSVAVPHFPKPGETVLGYDLRIDNGGKGANQAVAAARLGAQVAMVGAVGADADGTRLRQALAEEGIDVTGVSTTGVSTGAAFITIDDRGENSIVVASGANAALSAESVAAAGWALARADIVLAQLEIPLAAVAAAARAAGGLFMLNPAPAPTSLGEVVGLIDVLVPNRGELTAIVGREVGSLDDIASAVHALEVPLVVVTLGADGCLVVTEDQAAHVPAIEAPVVDTTAAGDSFCGALAVALAGGAAPVEAAQFAATCAAWTVGRRGAQAALPRSEDIA